MATSPEHQQQLTNMDAVRRDIRQALKGEASSWLKPLSAADKGNQVEHTLTHRCMCVDEALRQLWRALSMPESWCL
ncbi:MAG TPA: hypothetical protein VFX23_00015, partial [Limnobacter sp.]